MSDMKEATKRFTTPSKNKLRNLVQYRDMSDEEFDLVWEERESRPKGKELFEMQIEDKLEEFGEDYDLSDMKVNDIANLRSLVQLIITLEEYEQELYSIRSGNDGLNGSNIQYVKKLTEIMSDVRSDISKIQTDLKITRKVRSSDKDVSVIAFIDSLKSKARRHYESRMCYVYCPKCNMLLGTVWSLYPTKSEYKFVCQRKLSNGNLCETKVTTTIEKLLEGKGTNVKNIVPEAML